MPTGKAGRNAHAQQAAATLALHAGQTRGQLGEPVASSPVLATSFLTHPDASSFSASELPGDARHFYTRWSNPTLELLETRLAALEGGEAAVSFASGMAAISGLFSAELASGDHLVVSDVCYAGVAELAHQILTRQGIAVSFVDTSAPDMVAASLRPNTRLVHVETPANPTLKLSPIGAIAAIVHAHGAALSVDSTIATPIGQQPLARGADYVVHALTKYVAGHGDALGGVVIGSRERMDRLRKHSLIHHGGVMAPFNAWLILRGLETLVPRMMLHEMNARAVEAFLSSHPAVERVYWPGSPHHPQHELARQQMRNCSGLLSFSVRGDGEALARRLAGRLGVFSYAVSLGKTKSLLVYIGSDDILRTSFRLDAAQDAAYRAWAGDGLFRVSVGLEDQADLIADLEQALAPD